MCQVPDQLCQWRRAVAGRARGGNLKRIFHDKGTLIIPGKTRPSALADYRVYDRKRQKLF